MLDLEILRLIWWVLLGLLLVGFAITDGFDFGAAVLLPLVARKEIEKRIVLNSIGPFWEGNQVWIILGAGAIFAAWPVVYAVAFSGLYFVILLLLLTMGISRPVSFKYRSKLANRHWRDAWDWAVFIGGLLPALIFGILVGNVLTGVPFNFDNTLRIFYSGSFLNLFSPFACWCGLTSLFMLVMHGGLYLAIKTENPINRRAVYFTRWAALLTIIFFAIGGIWVSIFLPGYQVANGVDPHGFSNPLHKQVIVQTAAWIKNYSLFPFVLFAPALGFLGACGVLLTAGAYNRVAFVCSAFSLFGIITTVGVSMFPFILPSSSDPASSLLVWDSSSSALTLLLMLCATIIFLPLITIYTSWVYYALRGKVSIETIEQDKHSY